MPRERALLDGEVADDVNAVDLDARVREGVEPAAVERDAGRLSLAAHPPWRHKDDVVGEHFGKRIDVMSVEGVRPPLESLARGHRHHRPPSV